MRAVENIPAGPGAGRVALAIDIGGSKCLAGLVTESGKILSSERIVWRDLRQETVLAQITQTARALLRTGAADVIGVNIPGLADAERGVWVEASFSGIGNWPIARDLRDALGLPCYADNDANAAALAESRYGAGRAFDSFLYVTVSNGVGGAAIMDGRLLRGASGSAMEIGHNLCVPDGRPCGCGNRGCLEQHAAGPGIAQNYRELGGLPMPDGSPAQCDEIARRARAGEPAALQTFELEGEYLGMALAQACNLFNPQAVIIGGGVSMVFDLYRDSLCRHLKRHVYRKANPDVAVLPTALGYEGALLGAAVVGFDGLNA